MDFTEWKEVEVHAARHVRHDGDREEAREACSISGTSHSETALRTERDDSAQSTEGDRGRSLGPAMMGED